MKHAVVAWGPLNSLGRMGARKAVARWHLLFPIDKAAVDVFLKW